MLKYSEINSIEKFATIADIIERVEISYAIEYLESKLNPIETDLTKNITHFDSLILLSDYYLKIGESDKSFQTVRRAGLLVINMNEKYIYLIHQIIIAERSAVICYEGQKTPLYADYLNYQTVAFILKQCINLLNFRSVYDFYRGKEETELFESHFTELDKIKTSLDKLNIVKYREELVNNISDYTFNKLPIDIGFPEKYLSLNFEFPNRSESREEYFIIMNEKMEYDKIEFSELGNIYIFVSNVFKKYFDLEKNI
jgi:hypothetical protein